MPEPTENLLRKACLVLTGGIALRLAVILFRPNPLAHLVIPPLPRLSSEAAEATNHAPSTPPLSGSGPGSTQAPATGATNRSQVTTNQTVASSAATRTNTATPTNAPLPSSNAPATAVNPAVLEHGGSATNVATNTAVAKGAGAKPGPAGTNAPSGPAPSAPMNAMRPPGMRSGPSAQPAKALDPLVQARIDKIIQSELLGPVPHPLPLALLGIAGPNAFIRSPGGQSGMIREGGEIGGVKLLRIGINRVLVEEAGTKKELTIFDGAGGDSLLPK